MAYTVVPTVVDGDDLTDDFTLAVKAAIVELQAAAPVAVTTWSSPIAGGITAGNGTTVAYYYQAGMIVVAIFRFALGTTSAITGDVSLTLPVTALSTRGSHVAWFDDGGTRYQGAAFSLSTTGVVVRAINTGTTYATHTNLSATVPFTWGTGDEIEVTCTYLAA